MQEEEKNTMVQIESGSELQQNDPNSNDPSPQPSAFTVSCFEWVDSLVMALVAVVILFTFLFRVVTVDGTSMLPNLYSGDRIVVSSYFYQPKQNDVVVLKRTIGLTKPIVKRVIALPGQTVNIDYLTGTVSVDGKELDESAYIENGITHEPMTSEALLQFPQTVPAGHIFVLGDNREVSEDSRFEAVGMVDERYILGKAEMILFPISRFGRIGS
ncbi:signal peptidase I [Faecalispora anaeroviscerum]|uniref:signal peptidase I n=1 Tax=Faecalispora anaeroviscerum TaxID=2991836 RepID=UPI0024B9F4E6|nr:signal peptidase I [Faecalispora anaeroviscerum]